MSRPADSVVVDLPANVYTHLLLSVLDTMREGIEVIDRTGRVVYVNDSFTRITGVPASERLGRYMSDIMPDGELMQVLRTGKPVLTGTRRAAGSDVEVVVNALPLFDATGSELIGAVLVIRDVSTVLSLSRELQRLGAIVDSLQGGARDLNRAQYTFADIVGSSAPLRRAIQMARKAAETDVAVLITGESGTGKELFAHAIHNASRRRGGPFVSVNCAAIPDHLLESEIFGYEKGAFTGASTRKLGMFELAHRGTIFLDEIGEMPLNLQAKLLRVLQEREFFRLGGLHPVRVDVRVVASTNVDLIEAVHKGTFRADLFFRLGVMNIQLPPLRERSDDLPELVDHIIGKLNQKMGRSIIGVSKEAMDLLMGYHWPGNIRELENVLQRAAVMISPHESYIDADVLSLHTNTPQNPPAGARTCPVGTEVESREVVTIAEMEKRLILDALNKYGRDGRGKRLAARALGLSLSTLYNKISRYGIADSGAR